MAIQDSNNLFQLKDGRLIASEEVSEKMRILVAIAPEKTQTDATNFTWDESGMAELFAECYLSDTRYCPERKSWYTYDLGVWKKDAEGLLVSNKIREFVRLLTLYSSTIEDSDKRTEFLKFITKMGDRRFRERLAKDARDNLSISATDFDSHPYLINCMNGTYDLESLTFREHDWRDFLTMQTNFDYVVSDDNAKCARWEKFIKEVCSNEKDKIDYLQKALGYSILGTANEECMFILYGKTTRNGKSTLLSTIDYLLGDYASVSPVSIICKSDKSKNAEAASPTLASLKGKRFVSMAESNQYGRFDEEVIKQLTGGEEITARNLYESNMTYLPQFTLWLSCNDLPAVNDKSLFYSDRIRVIEFNKHFSAAERDETLKDLFKTQEAMIGIFKWLVAGYFKYKRFGLKMSEKMQAVVDQYEKDNDLVLQFLEEKCVHTETGGTKAKELYDAYKLWCRSNGYFICSAKKFNAGLEAHPEWHSGKYVSGGYPVYGQLVMR